MALLLVAGCCGKGPAPAGPSAPPERASTPVSEPAVASAPPLKTQVIEFSDPGDQAVTNTLVLQAKASSGLPVAFGGMGPCRIGQGGVVTFTGTGEVTIVAVQPGNREWQQAPQVVRAFAVHEATSRE